ncbi:MAG: MFS transporter [Spirochaetes bacterium]|nr:MFS transporter [Spirochaetota bacterium]
MKANGLSLKTKLGFGVCDIGGNLFVTIMGFYVFDFIKDVALLGAALAGTVLFAGKIWDAVIDPAIGFFSDRTKSRHGRRRPWMLGGAIAVVFFMILMYTNPHIESQFWLAVWVIIVYCLLVTAYSVINIPYGALTPELTRNYDEQTSLNAYRMSFAVVGTFIGVGGLFIVDMFANKDLGPMVMGGAMGLVICATALITYFTIKEPERAVAEASEQQGFLKTYAAAFRNRPFVLVLIAYGMHMAATAMLQSILRDYFQYIFGDEQSSKYALMPFLVMALVFIPIWTAISKRIGKKWAYNIGMSIFGIVLLLVFFFASTRGAMFMYVLMGIAGIGYSTNYVMPYAIIPDTVELEYAQSGVRREGAFYGLWNLVNQFGVGLALGISGWVLGGLGYVPNVEQTPLAKMGIRLLLGPIAAVFVVVGVVLVSFYPITRKYYEERIMPKVLARDKAGG